MSFVLSCCCCCLKLKCWVSADDFYLLKNKKKLLTFSRPSNFDMSWHQLCLLSLTKRQPLFMEIMKPEVPICMLRRHEGYLSSYKNNQLQAIASSSLALLLLCMQSTTCVHTPRPNLHLRRGRTRNFTKGPQTGWGSKILGGGGGQGYCTSIKKICKK